MVSVVWQIDILMNHQFDEHLIPVSEVVGMKPGKNLFTTGDVAKMCSITISTVQKYCEEGRIESTKSPVTGHRRIPRLALMRFMQDYDIPFDHELLIPFKVLVIDDEPEVAYTIEKMLKSEPGQYLVEVATGTYEGCRLLGSHSPDLVVLDIRMPGLDGREMMKVIKRQGRGHIGVLVVTGYPEDIPEMMERGADDSLEKPFDRDRLLKKVRDVLERKKSRTAGAL